MARGNDVTTAYSYYDSSDNFRLEGADTIHYGAEVTTLLDYDYAYDLVGNVTAITETVSGDQQAFTYDHLDRLLDASAGGGVADYDHAYQYDQVGNIEAWAREGITATYGYAGGIRPHAVMTVTVGEQLTGTFGYDDNGNMTGRDYLGGAYEQRFDVENRLVVVTDTHTLSVTLFAYDADGLRVMTVRPDGAVIYTPFPNYEEAVAGSSTTARAYYLLGGQAIAMRVSSDPAGPDDGLYYIHNDHLGSTTLLTDEGGGQVGGLTRYYPYGGYRGMPGTGLTDRGFTGHRGNNLPPNDLGLIYMNARYYVVYINRFLSADSIVPDNTNPQSFNRHSYVDNRPMTHT